jgi:hypothetical protein
MLKTYHQYIPQNLDIDKLLLKHPANFKIDRDKLIYLISLISEIKAFDHSKYEDNEGFIPLHSTKLQDAGIRDFPQYRDYLIAAGVWEADMQYVVGEKARGFRFSSCYEVPLKIESITKKTLIKNILKASQKEHITRREYPELYKWFEGLEVDTEGALRYLSKKLLADKKQGVDNALAKFNAGFINIDKIEQKTFHFATDIVAGRLHTILTNIKSELRNFLSYKGVKLVSVDFKNSQPLMALILFNPKFWILESSLHSNCQKFSKIGGEKAKITKISGDLFNISIFPKEFSNKLFKGLPIDSASSSPIMLAELIQRFDSQDVKAFKDCVQDGQLYEYIEQQLIAHQDAVVQSIKNRKDLKGIIFTVLFTDNRYFGQKKATPKRIFKKIFPNVYSLLSFVKRTDKTLLPILLQNIESKLVLKRIVKRITIERPDLPIFTIHDSIATTVGNEEYIEQVMREETIKAIGISPTFSVEFWNPININWDKLNEQAGLHKAA